MNLDQLLKNLPARPKDAHKGLFGHVCVVGGNHGMAGAALMAAESAVRVGAGLVSVATLPEHVSGFIARQPEIMVHGVSSNKELDTLVKKATVIVIGPGLGKNSWSEQMLYSVLESDLPMVVDADALNLISENSSFKQNSDRWILTPHVGEAARLLGISNREVEINRLNSVRKIQATRGGIVVLKGAGSLVCSANEVAECTYGNPGMSSGGMGDVLSGVIAGLLAQGLDALLATKLAVVVHAKAGDLAAEQKGERGLLATDLIPFIRMLLNAKA